MLFTSPLVGEVAALFAAGEGYFLDGGYMGENFSSKINEIIGATVDFICLEKRLVIELDGGQHTEIMFSMPLEKRFAHVKSTKN